MSASPAEDAPTTIPFTVQGSAPFSQSDLDAISAIPNISDVSFDPNDPTLATIVGFVPNEILTAKKAITTIARTYPNTPIRWSSPKPV